MKFEHNTQLEQFRGILEKKIVTMFHAESSGHDFHHLKRVYNLALHLQSKEGGDKLVIGTAALLHDIHRLVEKETGKFFPPKESLPTIEAMLKEVGFPEEKIPKVLHCIEYHEEYGFSQQGKTAHDVETLILQDADNLDAMGAIGVGRTFAFGGANGVPMWIPEKPFDRKHFDESERDPSTLHHFYSKLLKLSDNMNTHTAKLMAQERHEYMKVFAERFINEWNGEV